MPPKKKKETAGGSKKKKSSIKTEMAAAATGGAAELSHETSTAAQLLALQAQLDSKAKKIEQLVQEKEEQRQQVDNLQKQLKDEGEKYGSLLRCATRQYKCLRGTVGAAAMS